MKNTENEMNILHNADDEVIERMSEKYIAADEHSRERMFQMSERKYEAMKNNSVEFSENTVSGVEEYKKPKWYRTAYAMTASIVAVIGIAGSVLIIKNFGGSGDGKINKPPVISNPSVESVVTSTLTDTSAQTALTTAVTVTKESSVSSVSTTADNFATTTTVPATAKSTVTTVSANNNSYQTTVTVPATEPPVIQTTAEISEDIQNNNTEPNMPETSEPVQTSANTEVSELVKNFDLNGYWLETTGEKVWSFNNGSGNNLSLEFNMGSAYAYEVSGYTKDSIQMVFHFFSADNENPAIIIPADENSFSMVNTYPDTVITTSLTRITKEEYEKFADSANSRAIANFFCKAINLIDNWGIGNVEYDINDSIYQNDRTYYRVSNEALSMEYLREYTLGNITEDFYNRRYKSMFEGDNPRFISYNGSVYVNPIQTSCGFSWTDYVSIEPDDKAVTSSSFTIVMNYDDFGATSTMRINVVLENGKNKIDSMVSSDGTEY